MDGLSPFLLKDGDERLTLGWTKLGSIWASEVTQGLEQKGDYTELQGIWYILKRKVPRNLLGKHRIQTNSEH